MYVKKSDYFTLSLSSLSILPDNDVDGETLECGMTDNMISYIFSGSFKKQAKFSKFVRELKDVVILTLEPVPEEFYVQPLAEER